MKVYVAAPWKYREDMVEVAELLEAAGHTITHKWWLVDEIPEGEVAIDKLRAQAVKDMRGVRQADALVLINSAKSEGKAVEQGLALAYGIPIIAVGVRGVLSKNVFHYLKSYTWASSVGDAIKILEWLETK